MENFKKIKWIIGLILVAISLLLYLIRHFFLSNVPNTTYAFSVTILLIAGLLIAIPFEYIPYFFYDNREYDANQTDGQLVKKLRYRAILFNNISIAVLLVTVIVICLGFYLLIDPPLNKGSDQIQLATSLTIRISSSVLLIFLVQIFFRVFKYTLRVAAFYNGRADGIELSKLNPKENVEKLMASFTPDQYDITDLQQSSITDNLIDALKGKVGK